MGLNFFYTTILLFFFQSFCFGQNPSFPSDTISDSDQWNLIRNSGIDSLWSKSGKNEGHSGKGQILAIWEAGKNSHPDLSQAKWKNKLSIGDSFIGVGEHANLMADIIFSDPNYKQNPGIAFNAKAVFFNTENFWKEFGFSSSKFSTSLHSYALNPGWLQNYPEKGKLFWGGLEEVNSFEDYNFGFYNNETRLWDSVLFHNPNHLAIKSAGNSRGEMGEGRHYFYRPIENSTEEYFLDSSNAKRSRDGSDKGFDALPSVSVAKNILLVGSVQIREKVTQGNSKITPTEGSSFGPTDDGRIKPDLVALGGKTSQSAAFVAGATLILQELFELHFSREALSDEMKCILIHTADDVGKYKGPDYKMGWGLINTNRAARFISSANDKGSLIHDQLKEGDSIHLYYQFKKGEKIKSTLVWNDPEAKPLEFLNHPSMLNNRKTRLVNDLDLKITEMSTGCEMLPYVLNPDKPLMPAKNSNNSIDNVESITLELPIEGWYRISISHKGKLKGASQNFALVLSGLECGFAFDGFQWFPSRPDPQNYEAPILILNGVDKSKLPNLENFKNIHFH